MNGHGLEIGDEIEVVSVSAAQRVGLRAKVASFDGPSGWLDMRWNESRGGGANHWFVKGEYVRFAHRDGHDCHLCAVTYVHDL